MPGKSLGGVRLGWTLAQVERAWGETSGRCHGCATETRYFNRVAFRPEGAGVTLRQGRVVAVFTLWAPRSWHTSRQPLRRRARASGACHTRGGTPCSLPRVRRARATGRRRRPHRRLRRRRQRLGLWPDARGRAGLPLTRPARATRRAARRAGSGCRGWATGPDSRRSRRATLRRMSMQAPASRGPMMSPIPFVVVARPAIAPRSFAGMSLNRRPQASVITAPPADGHEEDDRQIPGVPLGGEAAAEQAETVDERRADDHARQPEPVTERSRHERRHDVPARQPRRARCSTSRATRPGRPSRTGRRRCAPRRMCPPTPSWRRGT